MLLIRCIRHSQSLSVFTFGCNITRILFSWYGKLSNGSSVCIFVCRVLLSFLKYPWQFCSSSITTKMETREPRQCQVVSSVYKDKIPANLFWFFLVLDLFCFYLRVVTVICKNLVVVQFHRALLKQIYTGDYLHLYYFS